MLGLALEGGGVRGSFHIGVVKAFLENGYGFDGVVGTSIGSFNAALIVQGDFEMAYDLWMNMEPSQVFDIEDKEIQKLINREISVETMKMILSKAKAVISNLGVETVKLKKLLNDTVDEDKLRASNLDFGLVTVSLPDFKALELYKEDIQSGMLTEYIMASSNFPGLKLYPIDGKYYIDGGIQDNCPVNMLIRKGYEQIIAVRISPADKVSRLESDEVDIINIIPSEELGNALVVDNALIRRNIKMGYCDARRVIEGLYGHKYYIEPYEEEIFFSILNEITNEDILKIGKQLKIPEMSPKRMLFERIVPSLAELLHMSREADYEDIFIALLELLADKRQIERYHVYTIEEFVKTIDSSSLNPSISKSKFKYLQNIKKLSSEILGSNGLSELVQNLWESVPESMAKREE